MGRTEKRGARRVEIARRCASRVFRIALAPILVCVLAGHPSVAAAEARQSAAPAIGAAAVAFDLKTLDGEPLRLEKFKGRALIMNFFASWCDPCREEMPLINALASKANEKGYAVLGIAIQDRRASVMEFARETKAVFPLALDLDSKVQRAYRVFGPPATFFVDSKGVLREVVLGPLTSERVDEALKKAGVRKEIGLSSATQKAVIKDTGKE